MLISFVLFLFVMLYSKNPIIIRAYRCGGGVNVSPGIRFNDNPDKVRVTKQCNVKAAIIIHTLVYTFGICFGALIKKHPLLHILLSNSHLGFLLFFDRQKRIIEY